MLLLIVLCVIAWVVLSGPLAILVGRAISAGKVQAPRVSTTVIDDDLLIAA